MRFKLKDANERDEKYDLLLEFGRLIEATHPTVISMENVPQIRETNVYNQFLEILTRNNYHIDARVIFCPDYGIPQTRRRFVLVASALGPISIIDPTHNRNDVHVQDYIGNLPPIAAGQVHPNDDMHRSASLSAKNLQRIRASIPGGTWRDWPEDLRCECHKKESGQTYSSVYGRMTWEQIGPTITTQFYSYGTGRYGHPEQDRALSLREGALLQTFPRDYNFINPDVQFVFGDIARHIGNAVPVRLGEVIGISILNHLEEYGEV
jgi:DNA (cytosine-5)-methyltransferase 1